MIAALSALAGLLVGLALAHTRHVIVDGPVVRRLRQTRAMVEQMDEALLLHLEGGEVVFANPAANAIFFEGKPLVGQNLIQLVDEAPPALRAALLGEDSLFTIESPDGPTTYQLIKAPVSFDGTPLVLWMVSHLTREVARREVEVLKKVIRVIAHELNNSLGSMGSLIGSARFIAGHPEHQARLEEVLTAIEERSEHLKGFLESYAALARLPRPRKRDVDLLALSQRIATMFPAVRFPEVPVTLHADEGQLEQALINLLKNAHEAGGADAEIELPVDRRDDGWTDLRVLDRGTGFSEEALQNALLPFYTTKVGGSGMGLALCREVAEGHGGSLGIRQRASGGTAVTLRVPPKQQKSSPRASLTLTRT